jgi:hypothetical protein
MEFANGDKKSVGRWPAIAETKPALPSVGCGTILEIFSILKPALEHHFRIDRAELKCVPIAV